MQGGERTMVSVLVSQRDRFRRRVQELEEGIAKAGAEATRVRKELEAARADNVALVERLRYVQGYQGARRKGGRLPSCCNASGCMHMFSHRRWLVRNRYINCKRKKCRIGTLDVL